ncbi:lantibiotic dehydratase [Embleya sp. AB8]|uniref:lantibiotic dehydratase n=1 Tax=Embleya sp. AB8 TaxID=3156304 RepID=UPI003C75564C
MNAPASVSVPTTTARSWLLGRLFMLRVAGLPIEAVLALRAPEGIAWADEVLDLEGELATRGGELGDRLAVLVGGNPDGAARRALLGLRRKVFNNRPPGDAAAVLRVVDAADAALGAELVEWIAGHRVLARLRRVGPDLVDRELTAARGRLREIAGEPRFRSGLLLASPTLDGVLDGYRRGTAGPVGKSQRKVERSLLEYVYRTACKTSPFSTLTGVTLGEFTDPYAPGPAPARVGEAWRTHPRLNVAVLSRLAEVIRHDPELREDLPVELAAGWRSERSRIRYIRRTITRGAADTAAGFDFARDSVFFLRHGAVLDRVLALFEEQPTWTLRELTRRLSGSTADPDAEYGRYPRALLTLGLLQVPALQLDVHRRDPVRAFAAGLRELGPHWSTALAEELVLLAGEVDAYAEADPTGRRAGLDRLRTGFTKITERLGAADAVLPKTLIYEDASITGPPVPWDGPGFARTVGDPLRAIGEVLPAFDVSLGHRLTLKGFFVARYGLGGRCDDVLSMIHDFHEDIYDQYATAASRRRTFDEDGTYRPLVNWLHRPEIDAVDRARLCFVDGVRRAWAELPAGAEELELDGALLSAVADELTSAAPSLAAYAHFVQPIAGRGPHRAVLNRSFGALAFPFSRFTHCFEDTAGVGLAREVGAALGELQPPGALFAEIVGGAANHNLNLHARVLDLQLVYPGEKSSLPPEHQITLDDLEVRHDVDQDRLVLRSHRLDCEIIPLYLGYLIPLALPEIPRTLLHFSPAGQAVLDVWGGIPEGAEVAGVSTRPRVTHRGLVVARRRWSTTVEHLPVDPPGAGDSDRLLAWRRWQRAHGLPEQVFARFRGDGEGTGGWSKPQHFDLTSALSLSLLAGLVKTPGREVLFEEVLPDAGQLPVTSASGRHVAEMLIEVVSRPAPRPGPSCRFVPLQPIREPSR